MIFNNKEINRFLILLVFSFSTLQLQAFSHSYKTGPDTSRNDLCEIVKDNPILSLLDSMAKVTFTGMPDFSVDREKLNIYHYPADFIPSFSDSVYRDRLEKLSRQSPFGYIHHPLVRQYIDLYAVRKRDLTQRILGMSGIYFPLFEEQLDRFNLPLELKYLAVIESALNPVARSHAGAKGLWQFMYYTGKMYDLKVSSYTDDRNDPYKATIAACRHLKDLYAIYGDWSLVLAAYNSGAGNVNKAIRKAGGVMNYWAIQRFLPRETRDYVPAFIAASYVMHYAAEHNLFPVYPGILAADIDTVTVREVLSFDQITEMLNIPLENLRFLNPIYSKDLIPASPGNTYFLRLPSHYVADFINNEEALYAFKTQKGLEREKMLAQVKEIQDKTMTHVVRKGETISTVAKKYRCSVADIRRWNGLKSNTLKRNQELLVYMSSSTKNAIDRNKDTVSLASKNNENKKNANREIGNDSLIGPPSPAEFFGADLEKMAKNSGDYQTVNLNNDKGQGNKYIYHTIRHGDTLWGIANKYKGVTVEQIKQWNAIKNANVLKPGQKLKIALGEG